MTTSLWMAAVLACAEFGGMGAPIPGDAGKPEEDVPPPKPAASKVVAVTVYQGQALVTREVTVPEGEGTVELVVTPLPTQAVDGSLFAEGADGLRVLSTRFRTRAVKDDTRKEVRAVEGRLKALQADALRLRKEAEVREQDLQYLQKLEGFTAATLNSLTSRGRLDSESVITLSNFVMEKRDAKARDETDLRRRLIANTEAAEFARVKLAELSGGTSRIERDAVVVVQKARAGAGTVRLGYLAGGATWVPQYRLRGEAGDGPVRLEYLAAVTQQTGEPWPDVRVTLSTARPTQDSAPPDLLPLKMAVAENAGTSTGTGPADATDDRSRRVSAELEKLIDMRFPNETPLEDVLKYVRTFTKGAAYPEGVPVYVSPVALQEAEKTMASPVTIDLPQVPARVGLALALEQLGLRYRVKDGLVMVTGINSDEGPGEGVPAGFSPFDAPGMNADGTRSFGGAVLNRDAAGDQAEELRVADNGGGSAPVAAEKENPGVSFAVAGRIDVPTRKDPQLLEVARVEMPAEYYAKAVPVLTPRVYRLAKLTNRSDLVLLPGEATVHVGGDFVGRMRLPLVAAGEPFLAGFGVDPQLQVSRRLMRKARTVQGGNQIFTYEFRLGLRNFRPGPVKVELWDRLPKPEGEAVAVSLVKSSVELSADPMYLRTARMDNLLRWDVTVPPGTVGDKTMYLNYELRLEYARDLPQPRFLSGGLKENPIGGGAMGGGMGGGMGGMGGMGGGFRSVEPGGGH